MIMKLAGEPRLSVLNEVTEVSEHVLRPIKT